MTNWANEWLFALEGAKSEVHVFDHLMAAARDLGFEYCAYGLRAPLPLSCPKTIVKNNYPQGWQARYADADYLRQDPSVAHGLRTLNSLVWSDEVFAAAPQLWSEAQSFGLKVGWAQSSVDDRGVRGMLTLARSCEGISEAELQANEVKMRWLANTAHQAFARLLSPSLPEEPCKKLTDREIEILKWSADGKTSGEISDILIISVDTVNFHVKNAITKLRVPNKMAAVVRAAMLGLLA